ncbi:MAG TPA: copper oxidase, partial [Blastocatellia bacterium]|nr:copper oxidase [Blastocatellia bacterium]
DGKAMEPTPAADDPEDSGMKAFNYKTEPLWARLGLPPETDQRTMGDQIYTDTLSSKVGNAGCSSAPCDPATPIFFAKAGSKVRFRVLETAGHGRQHGFTIFGHHWNFEPWTQNSTVLGVNPFTFEIGSQSGIGPTRHLNLLMTAGGLMNIKGDFLYRTQESFQFSSGLWGIFRVE